MDKLARLRPAYGCIVVIGVGDVDTIGDGVGTGCALALRTLAMPATHVPAKTIPMNHRLMKRPLPLCLWMV